MSLTGAAPAALGISENVGCCSIEATASGALTKQIMEHLGLYRFRFRHENELQAGIALALDRAEIPYRREWPVGPGERLHFLCGRGVAIVVGAAMSAPELLRRVNRYTASGDVAQILVVTDRLPDGFPVSLNGKPLAVFRAGGSLWDR